MIVHSPPYELLVWNYKRANESFINAALNKMHWEFFSNKSVNQQVTIFSRTIMNVFSNFVPNKFVTFNDRDLLWMTPNLNDKINYRNNIYREYLKKELQNTTQQSYKITKHNKGIIRININ